MSTGAKLSAVARAARGAIRRDEPPRTVRVVSNVGFVRPALKVARAFTSANVTACIAARASVLEAIVAVVLTLVVDEANEQVRAVEPVGGARRRQQCAARTDLIGCGVVVFEANVERGAARVAERRHNVGGARQLDQTHLKVLWGTRIERIVPATSRHTGLTCLVGDRDATRAAHTVAVQADATEFRRLVVRWRRARDQTVNLQIKTCHIVALRLGHTTVHLVAPLRLAAAAELPPVAARRAAHNTLSVGRARLLRHRTVEINPIEHPS